MSDVVTDRIWKAMLRKQINCQDLLGIEKIRNRKEHFPQGFNNWNVCRDAWKEILKRHPQHARPLGMVCLGGWGGGSPVERPGWAGSL